MHIWWKFGDSSSNPLKVIARASRIYYNLSQNGQNDLEGQGQWPPFSITVESIPRYMFGANLVILAQIYDELLRWQAEFPRILSQNDLEGQGRWHPFSIPAESILGCMFGANLVILAQIYDELSCGQGKVYGQADGRTDGQFDRKTDRHRQRQYPFGLKGQGVKRLDWICKMMFYVCSAMSFDFQIDLQFYMTC